jgi:tyrosyl-tRNA synthetase
MRDEVSHGGLHPMKVKKDLAWGIVRDFHSAAEADAAAENWARQFQQRAVAEDTEEVGVPFASVVREVGGTSADGKHTQVLEVDKLIEYLSLASSRKEAQRLLLAGAVTIELERQMERHFPLIPPIKPPFRWRIRVGKRQKIAVIA